MALFTYRRDSFRRLPAERPSMEVGTLRRRFIDLSMGRVAYLRHGAGAPLLLLHGIPTSCRLWEPLLGTLGERYDCIVPDLLGLGQSVPDASADLASPGQAAMLVELLDALGVGETLLVLHDQGGAHGMQLMRRAGDRVRAVAFCDVVCYDNWPVPVISLLMRLGRAGWPARALAALGLLQWSMERVFPLPQTVTRGRLPGPLVNDWYTALDAGGKHFEDWLRYVTSQSPQWTLEAVPTLQAWQKPALVVWAAQDEFLPLSWGIQLARELPTAPDAPVLLPFAGHFWQAEVPATGARVLREFLDAVPLR